MEDTAILLEIVKSQRNSLMDQLANLALELHKAKAAIPPLPETANDDKRID